jgi:hypothetical protein
MTSLRRKVRWVGLLGQGEPIQYYWTQVQPDGSAAVFHTNYYDLVAPGLGQFKPLGVLTTTGTAGHGPKAVLTTQPLTASDAYQNLQAATWTFIDVYQPVTDAEAHYAFSQDKGSASKLRYKLQIEPGLARTITWMETFTPEGAGEPTDIQFRSENVAANSTATQAYTIDPFARAGNQPGRYRVVAFESDNFEATLTADTNGDGALLPASGPMTDYVIANADTVSAAQPYQLLANLNDDDTDGTPDAFDDQVNGPDDLADFFPVFLNIKSLLAAFPLGVVCKLSQADGALNFVYTDLKQYNAFSFRDDPWGYAYGPDFDQPAAEATVLPISQEGVPLSEDFLNRIRRDNQGVILIEARFSSAAPLVLTIETGTGVALVSLPLQTSGLGLYVDADRDGEIKTEGSDMTTVDRPYRFWLNDDDDGVVDSSVNIPLFSYTEIEENDIDVGESHSPDNQNTEIDGKRDLEDLTRLRITIGTLRSLVHVGDVQDGEIKLGLKWKIAWDTPAEERTPSIRLFISPDAYGSSRYLFDEGMAAAQVWQQGMTNFARAIGVVDADDSAAFVLPDSVFTYAAPDVQLLFEGVEGGRGELQLVILKRNQGDFEEIGQGLSVHLELKRVNELCHRWTCGDGDSTPPEELRSDLSFAHLPSSASSLPVEERDLVLYVHGYNMSEYLKQRWIETTYKRLWHLGYKGRVGGFTWPTAQSAIKFANSEMIAWQSGEKLCALLADLKNRGYRVHMLAHSLGNVVAAEALQLWRQDSHTDSLVETYIASQAAIPAAVYNPFAETMPDVENVPYSGIPRATLPPDVYARYWKKGDSPHFPETWANSNPSYSGKTYIQSTAGRWANFYNRNDYALSGFWEIGNRLKPAKLANFATGQLFNQYEYTTVDGFTKEFGTWIPPHWLKLSFVPLKFPDDRYDIFSYAAPAWSLALGTIPTGGAFTSSTNLAGAAYGYGNEHLWHSGQFRSYYAARWRYWDQLLIDAQLKTTD